MNSDLVSFRRFAYPAALLAIGVTDLAALMAFYEFLYLSSNVTFDLQMPPDWKPLLPIP